MKKILLRVTRVRTEAIGHAVAQSNWAHAPAPEVIFAERLRDPDINRENGPESAGKQEHAVSDLLAHAGQLHQFRAGVGHAHLAQTREVALARGNALRRRQQIRRAKTHL